MDERERKEKTVKLLVDTLIGQFWSENAPVFDIQDKIKDVNDMFEVKPVYNLKFHPEFVDYPPRLTTHPSDAATRTLNQDTYNKMMELVRNNSIRINTHGDGEWEMPKWEMPKWEYIFIDRDSNKIELKEQEYPKGEYKIPIIDGESKMMYFKLSSILHSDKVAYYMEVYRDE